MAEIINLRLARKAKARSTAQVQAAANRALHGRTRQEKQADSLQRERQEQLLDGARLESD